MEHTSTSPAPHGRNGDAPADDPWLVDLESIPDGNGDIKTTWPVLLNRDAPGAHMHDEGPIHLHVAHDVDGDSTIMD